MSLFRHSVFKPLLQTRQASSAGHRRHTCVCSSEGERLFNLRRRDIGDRRLAHRLLLACTTPSITSRLHGTLNSPPTLSHKALVTAHCGNAYKSCCTAAPVQWHVDMLGTSSVCTHSMARWGCTSCA